MRSTILILQTIYSSLEPEAVVGCHTGGSNTVLVVEQLN